MRDDFVLRASAELPSPFEIPLPRGLGVVVATFSRGAGPRAAPFLSPAWSLAAHPCNPSSRLASPIAAMFTTSSLALLTGVVLGMAANVYWYVAPQSPPSIPPAHAHPHPHHSTAAFMGASWSSSCRRVGARPGNSAVVELYRLQLTMNSPWGMANFGHTLAHRHPPMSDPSGPPRSARAG